MATADVIALISPPATPHEVGTLAEWQAIEQVLGVTFPSDFREFVFAYGSGQLGQFYWVWNPFWGPEFLREVRDVCGSEGDLRRQYPDFYPYPIYPERPGFLPWGSDDNGNYYGWLTEGPSDRWPVLTNNMRGRGYRLFQGTMTEYLAGVFRGEVKPLAGDYPGPDDLVFQA
jgi:hypothetical protein